MEDELLRYDPLPLILNRGGPANVLAVLDEAGLLASSLAHENLLALITRQRPEGGFPSALDPSHMGVRETGRAVRLLLHSGMGPETVNVSAALRWLLSMQLPDGGWSENPAAQLPPTGCGVSAAHGVIRLTAEVVQTLQEAGADDLAEPYWQALSWLYSWHCSEGGWPAIAGSEQPDPDSSTLVTFLLREVYGDCDPVIQQGRLYYERCLTSVARDAQQRYYEVRGERRGLDVYHLVNTVLEVPAAVAGYDVNDARIARIVEAIVDIQRRDGGWRPFWMEESDPTHTALTLRALVWVGALPRETLAEMVQRFMH